VGAGVAAALAGLGVAVAVGAVPTPLTSNSAAPLDAATLAAVPSSSASNALLQVSASPLGFATAKMPAPTHKPKPKPTPTHTMTTPTEQPSTETPSTPASEPPSQSTLVPEATAENQTPTGQNQLAWSEAILTQLGDPLTSANIISIGYWMQNEAGSPPSGIVGENNPINVSETGYGNTPIQYEAPGYYLQSYPTAEDGVEATAAYLNNGSYSEILNDLKEGEGLSDPSLSSELSEYSGGGYTTIPDSWGQSQGQPLS
jgi:hypothetical protein